MSGFVQLLGIILLVAACWKWVNASDATATDVGRKGSYLVIAFTVVSLMYPSWAYLYVMLIMAAAIFYGLKMRKLKKVKPPTENN